MSDADASDLRERVAELEARFDALDETVADDGGREWSVYDLMDTFRLSRRQALAVFGLLAAGYPLAGALVDVASAGSASDGELGTAARPQDAWLEDLYDKDDTHAAEFVGSGALQIDHPVELTPDASGSGTKTIDLQQGTHWGVLATGDVTVQFSNVTATPDGNFVMLYFKDDDGNGPYSISWPSSVVWDGGSAVTEIPGSGDVEVTLTTRDGGSTWRARKGGESFA